MGRERAVSWQEGQFVEWAVKENKCNYSIQGGRIATQIVQMQLIRDKNESDEGKTRVNDICRGHGE